MSKTLEKVAVVIPCYNEAASIAQVIAKFPRAVLAENGLELTVYVVDNNSSDGTAEIAKHAGATVIYEGKKGKGNALRAGFRSIAPDADYVVMLDGDDTYSPEEILRLIEPLRSDFCNVVIGSRLGGRIQDAAMTTFNRLGNWVFTAAVRVLYRANVSDVLTGYFAWKKSALDTLHPHLVSNGFAVEMEMITKMARLGHEMTSVPISYHPRAGTSNLHPVRDGARILSMLLRNLLWYSSKPSLAASSGKKLVFVSDAIYPYMKGGKEKRLYEMSKRLAAMGHDVHIYTMHWWDDSRRERLEDGVHLHALCKRYPLYAGNRRSVKQGIMFGLATLKLLRVPFDTLDVDHMPFFPIIGAWVVCRLRGRKLYGTWHEALTRREWVNYMGSGGHIAAAIERLTTRLPHTITAVSPHTQELLAKGHGRTERVWSVSPGIDTVLLAAVKPANEACDVLYAGRLVKDKHVEKLVAAVEIIARKNSHVRCTIIGSGPEKDRLMEQVKRRNLQRHITFLPPLPDAADVYAYMKVAKVFCTPSVREGFGVTALEALGCGTPVVMIDSPANAARCLINEGKNGSLVPLTERALAQGINQWLDRTQKPDTAAGVSDYDWQRLAAQQLQVYTSLKILHVTKKYPHALGGDAVTVANLQHQQEEAGHRVAILSSNCAEIRRGERIHRFGLRDTPAALDSITPRRILSLGMLFFKAFQVLRQERPDVIHAHSVDMAFCVSFAARLYRVPVVHTFHIVTFYDQQQSALRRKSELLLARGARLRAVTAPNWHDVAQLRAARLSQTVLLPNGVDLAFWRQASEPRQGDEFIFLAVGRLEPQKGYEFLVKAVALLKSASPQLFRVLIAGEGTQQENLVRLAQKLGVTGNIDFVGRQSPEELRGLLAGAGAAVFPSLYETTPLTLLEAWAAAVPVIATRVGILRDASLDTRSVFLVAPQNEESLMQAMQLCMSDASLRLATASAGHHDVQKYAWSQVARTAEAIYGRVT